jgi:hypothetical protein
MAENVLKTVNYKKYFISLKRKSNIECYPKFIDEGFKKLFLKKMYIPRKKGKENSKITMLV